MLHQIKKLLVANRGEIACRIMRTARKMNIETMAVYSSVDSKAMHVQMADEAHHLGGPEPQESYLNQEKIFQVAHKYGASAIHPGYGFLSENSEFSERCLKERLIFVGPSGASIRTMGIKNESKRIMIEANVPVVPGYHGLDQDDKLLAEEARKIGYPVLIKPVRGGGGKGMRIVYKDSEFMEELESSRREALKSFNDQSVLLEKYIERPRHIEVQVFGDLHGNYVYLYERDCSVQRRHQKIIEEAPAPLLDHDKQKELGLKAVAAAKAVDYVGAGTVEFIVDKATGEFYFMEMNTRLQVEHPITEMITGTDLVEWQLKVASGEPLPLSQNEVTISGHAFEARIYAEDPEDKFLPQTGELEFISLPDGANGPHRECVRLDTGVAQGDMISPYYDPMIAKLIVWDKDRKTALKKLSRALNEYIVLGVPTNISFLNRLATNESFAAADVGTDFIDLHYDELFPKEHPITDHSEHFASICAQIHRLISSGSKTSDSFRRNMTSFRMAGLKRPVYSFLIKDKDLVVKYSPHNDHCAQVSLEDAEGNILVDNTLVEMELDDVNKSIRVKLNSDKDSSKFHFKSPVLSSKDETIVMLQTASGQTIATKVAMNNVFSDTSSAQASGSDPLHACAPMPGIVEKVLVSVGDTVQKDQSLIVISAMKMEYTVKSGIDGQVAEVRHGKGDFVAKDSILIRLSSES